MMITTIADKFLMILCIIILTGFFLNACRRGKDSISSIPLPDGYLHRSHGQEYWIARTRFHFKYRAYLFNEYAEVPLPVFRDFLNRPYVKTNALKSFQAEQFLDHHF